MLRRTLLTLASLSLVAQTTPEAKAKPAPAAAPVASVARVAERAPEDKIIAKVGTEVIRESDIEIGLNGISPQQRKEVDGNPEARQRFVKSFVEFRLLVAKGRKLGLDKTDLFNKKMAFAADQIIATDVMAHDSEGLKKKIEMTDAEMRAYYDAHKDKFQSPADTYSARHILVKVKANEGDKEGLSDADAKAKIAKIQAEMKAGKKLADLAKAYSDDPGSKDNGGLYENFDPGQMVAEFGNAVKTQPIGVVGEPVKTQFGYHLIEVTAKTPKGTPKPLESVKGEIQKIVGPERQEKVWSEYLEGIKKEIPFEYYGESKISAVKADVPAKTAPKAAAEPKKTDVNSKKTATPVKKDGAATAPKKND